MNISYEKENGNGCVVTNIVTFKMIWMKVYFKYLSRVVEGK